MPLTSEFSTALLAWNKEHARSLPWRNERDPYRVWVSEIILQQTRVEQGTSYYLRFIRQFPTVEALAHASDDEVMRAWQGLGYYSRVRHLMATARIVAQQGAFPQRYEEMLALPGIGRYTAAAICSFAFGADLPAIDGNALRILSRYFACETPIDTSASHATFTALAADCLPLGQAAAFNQALMDLGALVCTPRKPACHLCPLAETCLARQQSLVEQLPRRCAKTEVKTVYLAAVVLRCPEGLWLHRRDNFGIWAGLWEPLMLSFDTPPTEDNVTQALEGTARPSLFAQGLCHRLTHRLLCADAYSAFVATPLNPKSKELLHMFRLIPFEEVSHYALPRLVEKIFSLLPEADTTLSICNRSPQAHTLI